MDSEYFREMEYLGKEEPIQDDPRYAILRERLNKPQRLSATSEEWEALEGLVAERDRLREPRACPACGARVPLTKTTEEGVRPTT